MSRARSAFADCFESHAFDCGLVDLFCLLPYVALLPRTFRKQCCDGSDDLRDAHPPGRDRSRGVSRDPLPSWTRRDAAVRESSHSGDRLQPMGRTDDVAQDPLPCMGERA